MSKKANHINVSNIIQTKSENGLATNGLTFTLSGSHVENVFSNTIIRTIIIPSHLTIIFFIFIVLFSKTLIL